MPHNSNESWHQIYLSYFHLRNCSQSRADPYYPYPLLESIMANLRLTRSPSYPCPPYMDTSSTCGVQSTLIQVNKPILLGYWFVPSGLYQMGFNSSEFCNLMANAEPSHKYNGFCLFCFPKFASSPWGFIHPGSCSFFIHVLKYT